MKKFIVLFVLFVLFLAGCSNSAARQEQRTIESALQRMLVNQPAPGYEWSATRATLIQIYDQTVPQTKATYSLFVTPFGDTIFRCPSLNVPVPADTQLTNPLQAVYSSAVIEQADPPGVYTSKNTNGTWVLCAQEDGTAAPVYWEGYVFSAPFEVEQVPDTKEFRRVGGSRSSMSVDLRRR